MGSGLVKSIQLDSDVVARRVKRSFAFIDLCGFCDFVDTEGDAAAAQELGRLPTTVRRAAAATSVKVDQWLGDGAMLVGDEREALVACVVAVTEAHQDTGTLPIRAGIANGEVLLFDGDTYLGRPVNLAARLTDCAEPHQVLASVQGLRLPPGVVIGTRTELQIKGFGKPVAVAVLRSKQSGGEGKAQRALVSTVDGLTQTLRALLGARD